MKQMKRVLCLVFAGAMMLSAAACGQQSSSSGSSSAQEPESRELLAREIGEVFRLEGFDPGAAVVANERQYAAVAQALGETREALAAARAGVSYDAVCVCIQGAADALLELTGEKASQAVVDQVFSRFCVGK